MDRMQRASFRCTRVCIVASLSTFLAAACFVQVFDGRDHNDLLILASVTFCSAAAYAFIFGLHQNNRPWAGLAPPAFAAATTTAGSNFVGARCQATPMQDHQSVQQFQNSMIHQWVTPTNFDQFVR